MSSSPLVEVRVRLQRYLLDVEPLPAFQQWFVTWRRRNAAGLDALSHDIGLRLAEYTRGDWTEPQLRGKLLELMEGGTVSPTVSSSSTDWNGGYTASSKSPQTT